MLGYASMKINFFDLLNQLNQNDQPQQGAHSRRTKSIAFVVVIILATAGWFISGMYFGGQVTYETSILDDKENTKETLFNVQIRNSTAQLYSRKIKLAGQVNAIKRTDISTKIGATVKSVPATTGKYVQKGDPIVVFKPSVYPSQLANAKAVLSKREIQLKGTQRLYDKKSRSKTQLNEAQAQYNTALSDYISAKEKVDSITIRAPYNGIINAINVEIGEQTKSGEVVASMGDTSILKTIIHVSENQIDDIKVGQTVTLTLRNKKAFTGKIVTIGNRSNAKTRTFPVEVHAQNTVDAKDGLSVTAEVNLGKVNVHTIPASILSLNPDGILGVRIVEGDSVRFKPVTIEQEKSTKILISGLPDSAQIITVGQEYVKDSDKVTVTVEKQ